MIVVLEPLIDIERRINIERIFIQSAFPLSAVRSINGVGFSIIFNDLIFFKDDMVLTRVNGGIMLFQ